MFCPKKKKKQHQIVEGQMDDQGIFSRTRNVDTRPKSPLPSKGTGKRKEPVEGSRRSAEKLPINNPAMQHAKIKSIVEEKNMKSATKENVKFVMTEIGLNQYGMRTAEGSYRAYMQKMMKK